jgi:hypothetical protein
MSFPVSFHLPPLGPSGAYWLDDAPDLSCQDSTQEHPVDDPLLSCNPLLATWGHGSPAPVRHASPDGISGARSTVTAVLGWSRAHGLIIRLIIHTIRRDRSGSVQIDEASNVSRPDPSGSDQIDAEHQATDLVVGCESGCCDVELDHQGAMVADRCGGHPGPAGLDRPGRVVAQDMVQLLGGGRNWARCGPGRSWASPAGRQTSARLRACSGRPPAAAAPPGTRPPPAAPAAGGRCGLGGWTDGWPPP